MLVRLQNREEGCFCVSLNLDGHKWYTVMGRKWIEKKMLQWVQKQKLLRAFRAFSKHRVFCLESSVLFSESLVLREMRLWSMTLLAFCSK